MLCVLGLASAWSSSGLGGGLTMGAGNRRSSLNKDSSIIIQGAPRSIGRRIEMHGMSGIRKYSTWVRA